MGESEGTIGLLEMGGLLEGVEDFIFEGRAFVFEFFDFGIGGRGLLFLERADFVVDEVMASDDFGECRVGEFEFFDEAEVFWELVDGVVVFGEHGRDGLDEFG